MTDKLSADIMAVYPDNDSLQEQIEKYAVTFNQLRKVFDEWAESGVRELTYNSRQEVTNFLEPANFSMTILGDMVQGCKDTFDKMSEELGHNVHECYKKGTLNEIELGQYEKVLIKKNGLDFSLNLVTSKYNLWNSWWKKHFQEDYVPKPIRKSRDALSVQMTKKSNWKKVNKFVGKQMGFSFKPVTIKS